MRAKRNTYVTYSIMYEHKCVRHFTWKVIFIWHAINSNIDQCANFLLWLLLSSNDSFNSLIIVENQQFLKCPCLKQSGFDPPGFILLPLPGVRKTTTKLIHLSHVWREPSVVSCRVLPHSWATQSSWSYEVMIYKGGRVTGYLSTTSTSLPTANYKVYHVVDFALYIERMSRHHFMTLLCAYY